MTAIPAPWKTTEGQPQAEADAKAKEVQEEKENVVVGGNVRKGRKRGSDERKSEGGGKRGKFQQQLDTDADNSCSDDDEPKEVGKAEGAKAGRQSHGTKHVGVSFSSSPGVPMAQSTPMAPTSSARSAFAMLQPPSLMHPPSSQHLSAHHFSAAPVGYFFPPPPGEPMFHPAYSFMPWPRTGPTAMGYPGGLMMQPMQKMEPSEMINLEMGLDGGHGHGQKRKPKRGGAKKLVAKEQDSGLGSDMNNTIIENDATLDNTFGDNNNQGTLPHNGTNNSAVIPLALHPISGIETYCSVPGRLTLLSNLKKYRVSIAEIQRRLSPPECLNASILGGILRKAKNKDGGRLLREQLMTYGVELTSGRRKQGPLTCFSSLVEEEAAQLAHDFNVIGQKHYPYREAATYAMMEVQNAQDASLCRMELYYASKFLNRILDFHRADRSPIADLQVKREEGISPELNPALQSGLANFSLLTHGFGGRMLKSMLESMQSVINECNNVLNLNYQQAAASNSQMGPSTSSGTPLGFKY